MQKRHLFKYTIYMVCFLHVIRGTSCLRKVELNFHNCLRGYRKPLWH